jgi:hypothetical protein
MPVIFPEHVTHSQVRIVGAKAVSAGFVAVRNGQCIAYGASESLNLEADVVRDSSLLKHVILNSTPSFFLV